MNAEPARPKTITAAAIASLLFAILAPAATAQEQSGQQAEVAQIDGTPEEWRSSHILVTPSRHLIGRDLLGEGEDWGTIKFLMIDVAEGNLIYALASTERMTGQFIAVPWHAVDAADWTAMGDAGLSVDASVDTLEEARRFDMEGIVRLTSPQLMTEIGDYFASVITPVGPESSALVFGRDLVGTITRPVAQVANQLEGSTVFGADGDVIGAIDDIMIYREMRRM